MLFWVLIALLTLIASLAVMWPFLRNEGHAAPGAEHDLAVYRDQLSELDRDARRGLIPEEDAAEARAEIGRRILRLKQAGISGTSAGVATKRKLVAAIAMTGVLAVPAVSWGFYALLGTPGLPALPLAARLTADPANASIDELIARMEAHLSANPDDARGWETLAPVYARLGRYADAAAAYRRTIELSGPTAEGQARLGEALVGESGGIVTADAEAAFEHALGLDPANPRARFFLAMARAQEGKPQEAGAIWQKMAAELPDGSAWKSAANQALAGLSVREGESAEPSEDELAAVERMDPEARQDMIEGMVASLDARLRENPDDVEGWRRLLRSYVVLGMTNEAEEALARARDALGPDSPDASALADFAVELGIGKGK